MNREQFEKIMNDDDNGGSKLGTIKDDNAFLGLQIIRKYLPQSGIEGADHDIIWSVDVDKLINAGITEKDAIELRALNWMIEGYGYMACFV